MPTVDKEKILVQIPAKYKDAIKLAVAFPNTYLIGMVSLGYQTAWKLFNLNENVKAIRWFTDLQEKSNSMPKYIGFSFSWELDYKNIFYLLEKNNIPLHSQERKEDDPIVFCGGQVPNANPGPFTPNFDFFLTGDLERADEISLARSGIPIASDVLKVAHHGSRYSTSALFLEKVRPAMAVISSGRRNRYRHPHSETIDRLHEAGVAIFRTDTDGTITFRTDGKNIIRVE